MSRFNEIAPEQLEENPFKLIGKDWMLITAEKDGKTNAMTASWGGFGVMWGKNVAYVVIRPQRYTKELIDGTSTFSLTFFDDSYRKTLNYFGTVSGRNEDKIQKSGLTLIHDQDVPYFSEASAAIFCKKLYVQKYDPQCFVAQELNEKWYPSADHHTLYISEITRLLIKE